MRHLLLFWALCFYSATGLSQRAISSGTSATIGITQQTLNDTASALRNDIPEGGITLATLSDSLSSVRGDIPTLPLSLSGDTIPDFQELGDLETLHPGYTYNQLKTIRQANWEAFQAACQYVLDNDNGGRVLLPPYRIEMHINSGEVITAANYEKLIVKGAGKETTSIEIYPRAKSYNFTVFNFSAKGSEVVLEDLKILTQKEAQESYNVVLRPGGNTNQIQISDSQVYATTATNFIGKTVYAVTDNSSTATAYTVTNYNSSTKTLTVSSTVSATGSDDAGIMGIFFPEDTPLDSITTYGDYWRTDNVESFLIYALEASQPDVTDQTIKFNNCYVYGFDYFVFTSGDGFQVEASNCYMSAHIVTIAMYSNYITQSILSLTNCTFEDNSHVIIGYINGPFTAGNNLGSTVYSHPNIQWRWSGCVFFDNNGGTTRQYTGGASKPTPADAISFINNCEWKDNQEYDILTSENMTSFYSNCSFSGTVFAHNKTTFKNCRFAGTISSYDDNGYLTFEGCEFTSSSRISLDQVDNTLKFVNCIITANVTYDFLDAKVDAVYLSNCIVLDNGASENAGIAFIADTYPPRLIVENCDFQDPTLWMFHRIAPNVTGYTLSSYEPALFKGCKFSTTVLDANQISIAHPNLKFENCYFSGGIANYFGCYNVSPKRETNKSIKSGSTINITPNYDRFYASGSITKIAPTQGVDGYYTLTAYDTVTITKYSGGNTGSNFLFDATILPGNSVTMYYNGTSVKSASTTTVTNDFLTTAGGSTSCFTIWGGITSSQTNPVKEYTMVVTAGAVTLTDIGNGILSGSGGYGWVDYFRNTVVLCFDAPPAAATTIEADYEYHTTVHQIGMWEKVE